jgi:predicted DsbA family dithiol-disulfide isomerase
LELAFQKFQAQHPSRQLSLSITWEPFFLNKDNQISSEGVPLMEYLQRKYGPTASARFSAPNNPLDTAGKKVGIAFNPNRRVIPTMDAHKLTEWVKVTNPLLGNVFMELLFQKYFVQGLNVAQRAILLSVVQEAGLNVEEADRILNSHDYESTVLDFDRRNKRLGINGVPFFIMGRESFSGAQPPHVFEEMFHVMLEEQEKEDS